MCWWGAQAGLVVLMWQEEAGLEQSFFTNNMYSQQEPILSLLEARRSWASMGVTAVFLKDLHITSLLKEVGMAPVSQGMH